jgi:hypothetical protein
MADAANAKPQSALIITPVSVALSARSASIT